MMIFLAIVAVTFAVISAVLAYRLGKSESRLKTKTEYAGELEGKVADRENQLKESQFRESILVAKLEQIDKVLVAANATFIRKQVEPFLLRVVGEKNGSR